MKVCNHGACDKWIPPKEGDFHVCGRHRECLTLSKEVKT